VFVCFLVCVIDGFVLVTFCICREKAVLSQWPWVRYYLQCSSQSLICDDLRMRLYFWMKTSELAGYQLYDLDQQIMVIQLLGFIT